jgi:methylthioribose-1-phosphate isomerase
MLITYQPLEWMGDRLRFLDQTLLPYEEKYIETVDYREVAAAISELKVRGAPVIGIAGAYGIALGARSLLTDDFRTFTGQLKEVIQSIRSTRPTARNLFWAIERIERTISETKTVDEAKKLITTEAVRIHKEESDYSCRLSEIGADLLADRTTVLTHCNTGPLATTGYGTALGVVFSAIEQGKNINVLVDETRPLLQGARLTTWELQKAGVPFKLITDSMAGYMMSLNKVDAVVVGADCIATNGDTANKIGTYTVAVLSKVHAIPFYVAAPTSTIDLTLKTGREITIEERRPEEVTHIKGVRIAPERIEVINPAFDVTPAKYITAIITEGGIIRRPFGRKINYQKKLFKE